MSESLQRLRFGISDNYKKARAARRGRREGEEKREKERGKKEEERRKERKVVPAALRGATEVSHPRTNVFYACDDDQDKGKGTRRREAPMWRAVLDEARIGMRSTRRWRDDHRVSQRPIGKMSSDAEPQKGPRRCSRASQGREGLFSDPTDPSSLTLSPTPNPVRRM